MICLNSKREKGLWTWVGLNFPLVSTKREEGLWTWVGLNFPLVSTKALSSETRCKFFSLIKTPEDYTIIVDEEGFLELPSSEHLGVADATWLALSVVSGSGSVKSVIAPLANQNICVHAVHLPDGLHPGV